jgi:RNA polymerase sigma factor (sigma-70 family)
MRPDRQDRAALDREFSDLVAAGWRGWTHAAWLLTRDRDDAEDLVQLVLTRTYAAWPRVRATDAHAYVRRAVVNAYLDGYRRRRVLRFLPSSHEEHLLDRPSAADDAAGDRTDLRALLATLSPRERAVVVCRHYLDQSQAETAEALGLPQGTVAATLKRALAKLRVAADPSLEEASR